MKFSKFIMLLLATTISSVVFATDLMVPSTTNPGGFINSEVPQLIIIGSDDNTSAAGLRWMIGELAKRTNEDGSSMHMSFYSNTETWGDDTALVNAHKEAYAAKHELGNHTKTHPYCIEWDDNADTIIKTWTTSELLDNEVLPVKNALITLAGVDASDLYGFRTPFLGFSNNTFDAMEQAGIVYDCSIGEGNYQTAGGYYWPYTLDTKNSEDANYAPGLPNWWTGTRNKGNVIIGKHAGLWELPPYNYQAPSDVETYMDSKVSYQTGGNIGGLDYNMWAKSNAGGFELNKTQSIATLENTFDLVYAGNRTPITIGCHSQMYIGTESDFPNISAEADRKAVFTTFLDYVKTKSNVWLVSGAQAINYCRQPVKASEFNPDDYLPENFNSTGETKYTLTVTNGIGDGDYVEGAVKTISADAAATGKVFDKWTGDVSTVNDVNAATTTITIGTSALTVSATYKDDGSTTGPDTLNPSINFTTFDASDSGWQVGSVDDLGSKGDVSKTSDVIVKGDFTFVPWDSAKGDDGYAYGSMSIYDDNNFTNVNYIKVTYKASANINIVLEQSTFPDGGAHQKLLTKSTDFVTVLLEVNSSNFKAADWVTSPADLDMSKMNGVSFEPVVADEGDTISIEISELVFYGYDDGSPVISNNKNSIVSKSAIISSVSSKEVSFKVPTSGVYSVKLFALNGKMVAAIPATNYKAGLNHANWNNANITKSIYLAVLEGNGVRKISKTLIK